MKPPLARLRVACVVGFMALGACGKLPAPAVSKTSRAEDARAVELMRYHGCGTCHTIPGVPSARGLVGPPLAGLKQRSYIGGVLTNTPENVTRWIQNPRAVAPRTAMPDVGVSEAEARVIAAYLYAR